MKVSVSNVLGILCTTFNKSSLFFIIENTKKISDSFVAQCSYTLYYFTYVTTYIHVVLCPSLRQILATPLAGSADACVG